MTQCAPAPFLPRGTAAGIENGLTFEPGFDENGLMPAIVTDAETGEVLMLAWMNAEALARSMTTGEAHFWSRSRKKLWRKGEESGNVLAIEEMRTDCDQDAIWMRVTIGGAGVACHTGERTCFYRAVPLGDPGTATPALEFRGTRAEHSP